MSVDDRRRTSLEAVGSLLTAAPLNARLLTPSELSDYRSRRVTHGWRIEITFPDQTRRLDVMAGPNFPRDAVIVALVDRPPFLSWPHVEKDGILCLLPSTTDIDHAAPAEVTANVLGDSCELVEQLIRGERNEDFRREFLSYWGWSADRWGGDIWSLLRPEGPSRHFYYWRGQGFYLLGETPEQLTKWLVHYSPGFKSDPSKYVKGTLLWLPELPGPETYPKSGSDLIQIAESLGAAPLLEHHFNADEQPLVVLGGESGAGPCFAATIATEAPQDLHPKAQHRSRLTDGFRAHKISRDVLRARKFSSAAVARANVERADAAWIHGRDHDPRFKTMRDSTITVLGCGSLGGHVAVSLAEAGVGKINLADPQSLQWPNVGRHHLSAHHVGLNKAEELKKVLRQQYPQARDFWSSKESCEELIASKSSLLADCDLIIATMGNWAAEGALNAWHVESGRPIPVLYAWSEPHAVAGHAVAIVAGACFQCGFHDNGEPRYKVAEWAESTTLQEPGCGAVFQPYGPIEFAHIIALTAEAALDCLLGQIKASSHRIWCGRKTLLDGAGGHWTDEWSKIAVSCPLGGFIEDRPWLVDPKCSECTKTYARIHAQ
jgi:molybdopterin/thiamine biosynthesis adenylyltransferase